MNNFIPFEETGSEKRSKRANKGIICDVRNCVYHDGVGRCMAEKIAIGPSYATPARDTVCATFRAKQI